MKGVVSHGFFSQLCFPSFPCCCPCVSMPTGLVANAAPSCPQNVNISGGTFTLSHGWAPGSLLTYSCPQGSYPVPASRLCKSNGQWQTPKSTLRSSWLVKAVCKREAPLGLCSTCLAGEQPGTSIWELLRVGFTLARWRGRRAKLLLQSAFQNTRKVSVAHSKELGTGSNRGRKLRGGFLHTISCTVMTILSRC
jgi:hypothetical protein